MPYFNFINIACPATRAENGRVYDPQAGAFLIPDPYVQEPHNPSNYNRYSYVLNNPLKYTDPSGYKFLAKIKNWIVSIIKGNGEYEGPESESGGSSLIIFNDGSFMASGSAAQRAFSFIRAEMAVPGITNSIEKYLSTINTIYSSSQVNIYFRSGENSFEAKFGNFDSQQYLLSYEMFKEASTTYLKDNGLADNAANEGGYQPILENLEPEYIGGYPLVGMGYVGQIPKLAKYVISSTVALGLLKYYQKNPAFPTPHYTGRGKQDQPFLNNNNNDPMIDPASPSIAFSLGLLDMYITWKDATNPDIDNAFIPDSTKLQIDFFYFNEQ